MGKLIEDARITAARRRRIRRRTVEITAWLVAIVAAALMIIGLISLIKFICENNVKDVQAAGLQGEPILMDEKTISHKKAAGVKKVEFTEAEAYLLAKIAMAEAEGESTEGKAWVMMVVLNRMNSGKFADSIEGVIFQSGVINGKTVYQFSVVQPGGRWWRLEPNEDCYEALRMIEEGWDESEGATYFEAATNEDNSWHARTLQYIDTIGGHKFYKEKANDS